MALEIEIVDFPMKNGDFSIVMLNYQRVGRKTESVKVLFGSIF